MIFEKDSMTSNVWCDIGQIQIYDQWVNSFDTDSISLIDAYSIY